MIFRRRSNIFRTSYQEAYAESWHPRLNCMLHTVDGELSCEENVEMDCTVFLFGMFSMYFSQHLHYCVDQKSAQQKCLPTPPSSDWCWSAFWFFSVVLWKMLKHWKKLKPLGRCDPFLPGEWMWSEIEPNAEVFGVKVSQHQSVCKRPWLVRYIFWPTVIALD
jgi:hypothetical protein